jgi:hypothetical protein
MDAATLRTLLHELGSMHRAFFSWTFGDSLFEWFDTLMVEEMFVDDTNEVL